MDYHVSLGAKEFLNELLNSRCLNKSEEFRMKLEDWLPASLLLFSFALRVGLGRISH